MDHNFMHHEKLYPPRTHNDMAMSEGSIIAQVFKIKKLFQNFHLNH